MATIKVTYGQTSRKFTIASNTTWSEFESQLHDLFNISNEIKISISYIDEDGDVITLSTDSELKQILSDQEYFGTNVKFNIYTSENSDNNDWVLENAENTEEKDEPVTTLSDSDEEITSKKDEETSEETSEKDEEVVAYNISEPNETENTEITENKEINQVADVKTEEQQQQQQPVINNYPKVTVTDEEDDPLFVPTVLSKEVNSEKQSEELLTPVDSVNKEKEQNQETKETPAESSSNANAEKSSPDDEKAKESNEESKDDDSNIIFIVSSRPWIQRTYYRPRVSLYNSILNGPTYFSHFARPSRPRYSYIAPSYGYRRNPYFGFRSCGLNSRGFGGFGGFGSNNLYHFGL